MHVLTQEGAYTAALGFDPFGHRFVLGSKILACSETFRLILDKLKHTCEAEDCFMESLINSSIQKFINKPEGNSFSEQAVVNDIVTSEKNLTKFEKIKQLFIYRKFDQTEIRRNVFSMFLPYLIGKSRSTEEYDQLSINGPINHTFHIKQLGSVSLSNLAIRMMFLGPISLYDHGLKYYPNIKIIKKRCFFSAVPVDLYNPWCGYMIGDNMRSQLLGYCESYFDSQKVKDAMFEFKFGGYDSNMYKILHVFLRNNYSEKQLF